MHQLKRFSLAAAATAVVAESGLKNLLLWTLVTIGTPATTAGFVYEVTQMRQAHLQREADDRAGVTSKQDTSSPAGAEGDGAVSAPASDEADVAAPDTDIGRQLSAMLNARARFIDIHGADPETVTPAYQAYALAMAADDERMFARLAGEQKKDPAGYRAAFERDEARLRRLHVKLTALVPAAPAAEKSPARTVPTNQ